MELNWQKSTPEIWSAAIEPRHGYRIQLIQVLCENRLIWLTMQPLHIEREWVQQRLAVLLLELNDRYVYGANRLFDGPSGISIVHSHACDYGHSTPEHIAEVGWTVLQQMQELVTRLYAEDLILPAVESSAARIPHGR